MSKFARELEELINRHSIENESNTPDFILANYMLNCLGAGTTLINQREHWYGKALTIGGVVELRTAPNEPRTPTMDNPTVEG